MKYLLIAFFVLFFSLNAFSYSWGFPYSWDDCSGLHSCDLMVPCEFSDKSSCTPPQNYFDVEPDSWCYDCYDSCSGCIWNCYCYYSSPVCIDGSQAQVDDSYCESCPSGIYVPGTLPSPENCCSDVGTNATYSYDGHTCCSSVGLTPELACTVDRITGTIMGESSAGDALGKCCPDTTSCGSKRYHPIGGVSEFWPACVTGGGGGGGGGGVVIIIPWLPGPPNVVIEEPIDLQNPIIIIDPGTPEDPSDDYPPTVIVPVDPTEPIQIIIPNPSDPTNPIIIIITRPADPVIITPDPSDPPIPITPLPPTTPCVPLTCAVNYPSSCGSFDNGCGGIISCSCLSGYNCISGSCIPNEPGFNNSIIQLTGSLSDSQVNDSLLLSVKCRKNDNDSDVRVFTMNSELGSFSGKLCSAAGNPIDLGTVVIGNSDILGVTLTINEPCVVCSKTIYLTKSPSSTEANIDDNNFLVVLLLLGCVVFISFSKKSFN